MCMLPELEHDLVRPVCTMCACYRYSGASVPRYCGKRKGHRRYPGTGRHAWRGAGMHRASTQIYIVRNVLSTAVPTVPLCKPNYCIERVRRERYGCFLLEDKARLALSPKRKQKYQNGNIHRKLKVSTSVIFSKTSVQYNDDSKFSINLSSIIMMY